MYRFCTKKLQKCVDNKANFSPHNSYRGGNIQKEIMKRKTAYFKPNTRISNFIPVPRSILREDLTASAKLVYGLLVARTMLSQKASDGRTWTDEDGNVFILFSIRSLAEEARMAESTVKNALRELKKRGLAETRRTGFNRPNRIFVKYSREDAALGEVGQISPVRKDDNCPTEGQKTHQLDGWNPAPIYTDKDKQKIYSDLDPDRELKESDPVKVRILVKGVQEKLGVK